MGRSASDREALAKIRFLARRIEYPEQFVAYIKQMPVAAQKGGWALIYKHLNPSIKKQLPAICPESLDDQILTQPAPVQEAVN